MNGTISFSKGLADISGYNPIASSPDKYSTTNGNGLSGVDEKKLCTTCNEYVEIAIFRNHFKEEWHRYNLYRKQKSLGPINYQMFLERKEIAKQQAMIVKQKGQDHIKNRINSNSSDLNSECTSPVNGNISPNNSIKKREIVKIKHLSYSPGMNIFDSKVIGTPKEALNYMIKNHNFYLPEAEYISNLPGLLEYLGNIVFIDNECLYCGRTFASLYAVWHHMEAKAHQKIPYEMIEEIYQFYDFTESYAQVLRNAQLNSSKINCNNADDEWEDVTDDEVIKPEFNESQVLDVFSRYNLKPASIDENNNLTLPDGREVVNRSTAYIYKQHLRPIRIVNGGLLMSKFSESRIPKRDFKGKIKCFRDKIRQNIHTDVRSYRLFKVRSQNIIFN